MVIQRPSAAATSGCGADNSPPPPLAPHRSRGLPASSARAAPLLAGPHNASSSHAPSGAHMMTLTRGPVQPPRITRHRRRHVGQRSTHHHCQSAVRTPGTHLPVAMHIRTQNSSAPRPAPAPHHTQNRKSPRMSSAVIVPEPAFLRCPIAANRVSCCRSYSAGAPCPDRSIPVRSLTVSMSDQS
jgi:hypothetical protein